MDWVSGSSFSERTIPSMTTERNSDSPFTHFIQLSQILSGSRSQRSHSPQPIQTLSYKTHCLLWSMAGHPFTEAGTIISYQENFGQPGKTMLHRRSRRESLMDGKITLIPGKEKRVWSKHPWIYKIPARRPQRKEKTSLFSCQCLNIPKEGFWLWT